MSAGTATEEQVITGSSESLDSPWRVVLWNDPINLISYVIWVLETLFGYSNTKATALTMEVHNNGRAIVSHGPREKAEMDASRLHEKGLWATLERESD
ncbi:MAG: ATP-dependent Clp protease adapter ClpS [Actinomycetota bacterium]|nr:ATP-dependent Clp protease adapter ClpS [Actinomycetota bacterium]MDA8207407.1 ATP-dependent Clp protease adapter ClpS [Actinomycetota bacterium]